MKVLMVLVAACVVCGCGLTAAERTALVEESARLAGDVAAKEAYQRTLDELTKRGYTPEEAKRLAEIAETTARGTATVVAKEIAGKAIPKAEEEKSSKTGAAIASILLMLLQGASAVVKGGGA